MKSNSKTLPHSWKVEFPSGAMLRLSGDFSIFGLVFFVFKSLLGLARQWSLEKFAILTLKPRSHVRISIYRMYFCKWGFKFSARESEEKSRMCPDTLGNASDIYNQTKISTCIMFFPLLDSRSEKKRPLIFFFLNIKTHKKRPQKLKPILRCPSEGGSTQFSLRHRRNLALVKSVFE